MSSANPKGHDTGSADKGQARKPDGRGRVRLLIFAVIAALLVAGLMLAPDLWNFIPRSTRRPLIERLLVASVAGYGALLALCLPGLVVSWIRLVRSHRRGGKWRPWARAWLLCASALPALIAAEGGVARILARRGRLDDGRRHFLAAREADGFFNRCPAAFQEVYRDLAAEETILIDGPALLRAASPRGFLDYNLFHDAHHPVFRGHLALAEAVLRALAEHASFGWTSDGSPDLDPAERAAHFSIHDGGWKGLQQAVCA
jgi:hypothetical protein